MIPRQMPNCQLAWIDGLKEALRLLLARRTIKLIWLPHPSAAATPC